MKKKKSDKNKSSSKKGLEGSVEDIEKWIIQRRKFFIKLGWAVIIVILLLLIGSIIDRFV